jgi:hypothetical protein
MSNGDAKEEKKKKRKKRKTACKPSVGFVLCSEVFDHL